MGSKKTAIFLCLTLTQFGAIAFGFEPLTDERKHLFFVAGIDQGERQKQIPIGRLKDQIGRLQLYGIDDRKLNEKDDTEAIDPLFSNGKPKSKATIAKEERENSKKQKRQNLEAEKKDAAKIAELAAKLKTLEAEKAAWAKPVLSVNDSPIGQIGALVYPPNSFTQPDIRYSVPDGPITRGSAADVRSELMRSMRTDVSGDPIEFTIVSVINDESAIAMFGDSAICFTGIDAKPLTDDQEFKIDRLAIVDPPTRYETVLGSTKTVRTLRRLSAEEEKDLVDYVAKQLAANQPASVESPESSAESK